MSDNVNSLHAPQGSSVQVSPLATALLAIISSGLLAFAVLYHFIGSRLLIVDWRNPLEWLRSFLQAHEARSFVEVMPGFLLIFGMLMILGLWSRDRHLGKCVLLGFCMTHLSSLAVYLFFKKSLVGFHWFLEMFVADKLVLGAGLLATCLLMLVLWLWEPAPSVFKGLAGGVVVGGIPVVLLGGPSLLALTFNPGFGEVIQKFRPGLLDMGNAMAESVTWFFPLGVLVALLPFMTGILGGLRSETTPAEAEDPIFGRGASDLSVIFIVVLMTVNVFFTWVFLNVLHQLMESVSRIAQISLISPSLPDGMTLFLGILPLLLTQFLLAGILLARSQIKEGLTLGWTFLAGGILVVQGVGMYVLKSPIKVPAIVMIILGIVLFLQVRIRASQGAKVGWAGAFSNGDIFGGVLNMAFAAMLTLFPSWLLLVEFEYELNVTWVPLMSWLAEEKGGKTVNEILQMTGIGSVWPMHLMFVACLFLKMLLIGLVVWLVLRAFALLGLRPQTS